MRHLYSCAFAFDAAYPRNAHRGRAQSMRMDRSGPRVMEPSRQCVVLVGGLGTRLGEITRDTPKPLLAVDGQPFLAHLIRNGLRFGFDDFVLLAGFNASKIEAFAS